MTDVYWVCEDDVYPGLWDTWQEEGIATIGYPPEKRSDPRVELGLRRALDVLSKLKRNDRVVAFLKRGRVGGIGIFEGEAHWSDREYKSHAPGNEQGRWARVKWTVRPEHGYYSEAPEGVHTPVQRAATYVRTARELDLVEQTVRNEDSWSPFVNSSLLVSRGKESQILHPLIAGALNRLESGLTFWSNKIRTEYPAPPIGFIDILAKSKETPVVIEAKTHEAGDAAAGQVARYMAWTRYHLGTARVRGMLIAGIITARARYAASLIDGLELVRYSVSGGEIKFLSVRKKTAAVSP